MILNYSRSGGRSRRWCRTSRGRRCRSCWLERVAVEVAEVVVGVTGVSCFRYTLQWYTDFRFQYSQIPWKKVILRWFLVISSDFKWFQVILPGNLDITLLTPPVTPGVLDQPVILSTLSAVTDNGDGMISLGVAATRSSVITNNHQKSLILTNSCWTRPSCSSWSYTSWSRWQWRRSRTCRRGPSSSPRCTCSPWRPWSLWLLSSRSWFQRGSTAYGQVIKVIKSDQKWSKVYLNNTLDCQPCKGSPLHASTFLQTCPPSRSDMPPGRLHCIHLQHHHRKHSPQADKRKWSINHQKSPVLDHSYLLLSEIQAGHWGARLEHAGLVVGRGGEGRAGSTVGLILDLGHQS